MQSIPQIGFDFDELITLVTDQKSDILELPSQNLEFEKQTFGTSSSKPQSEQAGIENVPIDDIIDIIDGYVGKGYADSWPELRQLSLDVAENTGIFIDRVYTAKAILGEWGSLKCWKRR